MIIELKLLLLIIVANGVPILARRALADRFGHPVDSGSRFTDGRPVLGKSKTLRGIVASLIGTALAATVLGLAWSIGLLIALFAMLGDLFSSFVKRRLEIRSADQALGLDTIPESLLPLLVVKGYFDLAWLDIAWLVAVFVVLHLLLSVLLFKLRIRRHPY
jgi:hypothetical protein